MTDCGIFVLHDRRLPRSSANIDDLVVTATGVWVIDAERYRGLVKRVDKGGWRQADYRLLIDGRDRTALVEGIQLQVSHVERSSANLPSGPIRVAVRRR